MIVTNYSWVCGELLRCTQAALFAVRCCTLTKLGLCAVAYFRAFFLAIQLNGEKSRTRVSRPRKHSTNTAATNFPQQQQKYYFKSSACILIFCFVLFFVCSVFSRTHDFASSAGHRNWVFIYIVYLLHWPIHIAQQVIRGSCDTPAKYK